MLMTSAGGPEVLALYHIDTPELRTSHHVRVKLSAAGVNPLDTKLRTNPVYYPDKLPTILGCDGSGIIDKVGSDVTRFKVGDSVYFNNGGIGDEPGCYAEYTILHEDYCAASPTNVSLQDAAALPLVLLTAWESLVERVNLQPGQTILIHAAAGGVGHIAVQLAHHLGARIAVTVSDDKKAALAQGLDAEKIINYKSQDFVSEIMDWTNGEGVDVVFDTIGGESFIRSLQATKVNGTIVSLLATPLSTADVQLARFRNLSLSFELMLTPQILKRHSERTRQREILERCTQLIESGKIGVLVSYAFPLDEVQEAHRIVEQGSVTGKIIVTMNHDI